MIPISNAQGHSSYGYGAKTDFYIVMIIPLVFNSISFLGTLYIFYRTFSRWKYGHSIISLSFRFPFYIAITASKRTEFINKNETISWPFLLCEILGIFFTIFILLNILLVAAISIVTWLRVVQERYLALGKYDYKIWLPIIFISLIIPLSSVNAYGSRNYSCGTKVGYNNVAMLVIVLIFTTLTTIMFCYAHVMKVIRNVKDDNSSITDSFNKLTDIERRTFKKVLTYILVFILQYIPIIIYDICIFLKVRHLVFDAIIPAVISIGGIGNVIQYLYNEGLSDDNTSNYRLESNEGSQQSQQLNNTMSEI
ncbi:hypothetical protein C1646_757322 [Rhizophagus diaphanus]|nr:hypothetical protein C1646_757322 [Rhizophagus diaphanus] [Rhizophagus sp. MUCL 43196]